MRDPREGLNSDGTIRTGACRERVPMEFEPIISAVLNAFDEVADESAELYLYGSVATGTARAGWSDVDLVAIDVDQGWCREASRQVSDQFASLCRGVEIGHASRFDYAGDGDEAYGNRVFLHHYCVPLAGRCVLRSPEPFQGDARAARGFNGDIGARLTRWRTDGGQARAVARKTLLAASGVVSILDGTWTTDRATAARRWREIEPDHEGGAVMLASWADAIDVDEAAAAELDAALAPDGIVANVVDRFAADIGLWP